MNQTSAHSIVELNPIYNLNTGKIVSETSISGIKLDADNAGPEALGSPLNGKPLVGGTLLKCMMAGLDKSIQEQENDEIYYTSVVNFICFVFC